MTDLLDIATRLEAACDITGKPIGRHMVPGMTKLGEMQIAMGAKKGDREAGELGEVTACMTACIDNEAKLFDALAIVAKEAVEALRAAHAATESSSLLQPATTRAPKVCYCKDTCGAPLIMGRQAPCIRGYQPGGTIPS